MDQNLISAMFLTKFNLLWLVSLLLVTLSSYSRSEDRQGSTEIISSIVPLLSPHACFEGGDCGGNNSQVRVHSPLDEMDRVSSSTLRVANSTLLGRVRITYISRHNGTIRDFRYFYERAIHVSKGDNLPNLTVLNPTQYGNITLCNFEKLLDFSETSFVDHVLSISDMLVVSDTIPDAVPFLARLSSRLNNRSVHFPNVNVVLQVTNRFDYCVQNNPKYYDFMRRVAMVWHLNYILYLVPPLISLLLHFYHVLFCLNSSFGFTGSLTTLGKMSI